MEKVRPTIWIGSSRRDLRAMPLEVRRNIGQALYTAQQGMTDPAAKPLKGFVGTRVMEVVERYRGDAYRAVYTTQFSDVIYSPACVPKEVKARRHHAQIGRRPDQESLGRS
jgi:phage-related protein